MTGSGAEIRETGTGASVWLTLAVGPLLMLAAVLLGWPGMAANLALLSASVFVASLLGGHRVSIPRTGLSLSLRQMTVFWAILNLGMIGGAVVAVASVASGYSDYRGRLREWGRSGLRVVAGALAGAAAFEAISGTGLLGNALDLSVSIRTPEQLLAGFGAMVCGYFAASLAVDSILPSGPSRPTLGERVYSVPNAIAEHALSALAGIVMYSAFRHFGYEFALVVVPLAVLGNIAYQIHVRRLAQKTREIVDASRLHLATVEALATAIDARDQIGTGHVQRTQIYAVGIGTALGLGEGELNALRAGALLHDIGKLAVPEHILNKPGRLTPAELEKTKIHADVGASILNKVGFPYPVIPTIRHHHEYWDGTGYPDGLLGSDIPVTARILAVADAYDSLRGARPYRPAVSREDACNFLRSRSGTQFDPHVVATLMRNLKKFEAEIEIHGFGYGASAHLPEHKHADDGQPASYVEQIKRANQEVFSLYEMARDFGASLDLEAVLSLLTDKVREFVPYDTCVVYLLDEEKGDAAAAHAAGRNREILAGTRLRIGEGASGYVLQQRKAVENVDPSLDFAFSFPEICEHYVGMASVPLLVGDRLIGAVSVFSGKMAAYEEEHLRMLETISRIAADAIVKSMKHAESEVFALTDPLTELPNARSLHLHFEKEAGRAKRTGTSLQLLMMDLDGFKAVNDNLGHKAGDILLRDISKLIKSELRDYDFLARYGGDEFVAIVPGTGADDVLDVCSRIEAAVSTYSAAGDGMTLPVGVSIGAASCPEQGESFEELMIAADKAMYRTKAFRKQRNRRAAESVAETAPASPIEQYSIHDTIPPEAFESEFVVELDERHIVTVNTVN